MKRLYALKDKKQNTFLKIFQDESDITATRGFESLAKSKNKNVIAEYTEDFALYFIAEFDDEEGKIIDYANELVLDGAQLQHKINNLKQLDMFEALEEKVTKEQKK